MEPEEVTPAVDEVFCPGGGAHHWLLLRVQEHFDPVDAPGYSVRTVRHNGDDAVFFCRYCLLIALRGLPSLYA